MTIQASNDNCWVIRENSEVEQGGIMIPDSAKKSAHKGQIISLGKLFSDTNAKLYELAIFNKSAGFDIEEEGITYTILRQIDIVGYDKRKMRK